MIEIEGYKPISEYAKTVNYSISMVRKLIKQNKIKAKKFKRRIYIWIE
jgi:hypothetical protein